MNPGWETAKNLLCVRLDTLGDVLMTTPAIRALKESLPGRRITLLTSSSGAEAADLVPEIDDVIRYEAPWMKAAGLRENAEQEFQLVERLRGMGFDGAVIFTVFSQSPLPAAFLSYLAGIPLRLAYCRENPYQLLSDWVPDETREPNIPHEVRRQLDLVARIGCRTKDERLSFKPTPPAYSQVTELLNVNGLERHRPWMVLHTGATAASRCYEPEKYAQVAGRLTFDHGFQVVLTGSKAEEGRIRSIQDRMGAPSISLAGQTSVDELGALLGLAPLLISNNSGPVHMAAAMGTPVVDLYALTNPQHTPWLVPNRVLYHDVPCKFCYHSVCKEIHHHCLSLVPPERVVQAAVELYEETQYIKKRTSER